MKIESMFLAVAAATVAMIPAATGAQDDERPPLYVSIDCMKSTTADYASVETDMWQPMHKERMNQGEINSWSLYWVMYGDRSRCDYYTVTTYPGSEPLNASPPYDEIFEAVHPDGDFEEAMSRTFASREQVASELWVTVDSIAPATHRFAVVNKMSANDPDAYERMESRVFKPGHQALVDGGYRSGWAMYALVSPIGTSIPYNYSTVDYVDHLNPVPMAEAMMSANPDRDLDALQELLALREQVSSETWVLVAATKPLMDGN